MTQARNHRDSAHRYPRGRLVGVIAAIGGLAGSVALTGTAGAATSTVTIATTKNAMLGTILVSGNRTVYTLKPSKTACNAGCLQVWPMVLLPKSVKHVKAGSGVSAGKLGTVKRGSLFQVTYGGKPLYWFSGDTAAGQVTGNVTDAWGKWSDVTVKATHSSSSGSSGSGGSSSGSGGAGF